MSGIIYNENEKRIKEIEVSLKLFLTPHITSFISELIDLKIKNHSIEQSWDSE